MWNATIPGSACIGTDYSFRFEMIGQEDCLYLNIYTPKVNIVYLSILSFYKGTYIQYDMVGRTQLLCSQVADVILGCV